MTKDQIILLSKIQDTDHFNMILDAISRQYESYPKYYNHLLKSASYLESNNNIPTSLFKYIDIDGGIASIEKSNIQFSHPLSFRHKKNSMGDFTEFWYERFYVDRQTLSEYRSILSHKLNSKTTVNQLFLRLLTKFSTRLLEINKILCLSQRNNNYYLYKETNEGKGSICIEYNTDLFKNTNNLLYNLGNFDIIYNKVSYVDNLVEYPIRFGNKSDNNNWLWNFLFIKEKKYSQEDEFRIIHTMERKDDNNKMNLEEIVLTSGNRLFEIDPGNINPLRINIDPKFINHVYYTSNVVDEQELKAILEEYNIPYSKLKK